jgi:hypothetical protein
MKETHLERLIDLADKVFDMKHDPDQLNINQKVLSRLKKIHPFTVSEKVDGNGPVAWVLVIPTTLALMHQFIEGNLSEKEMFKLTPLNFQYDALYLCSALVLEEYRRKGITQLLTLTAIRNIQKDHALKALFVWPFTSEGEKTSEKIARLTELPLYKRLL